MDAASQTPPIDIAALKVVLAMACAERDEVAAELAVAKAKASEDLALIAHQKLRFMPKPGEIVGALQGKQNEQSLLAWVKVTKGIRQVGASKTVIFDDPLIHAVIADLGGWIRLCRLTERELNFQQREFERLYACYLQRPLRRYPRQLTGIADTANAASGYEERQKPVLLGDPTQAAFVYKNGTDSLLPFQAVSIQQILQLNKSPLLRKDDNLPTTIPVSENNSLEKDRDD